MSRRKDEEGAKQMVLRASLTLRKPILQEDIENVRFVSPGLSAVASAKERVGVSGAVRRRLDLGVSVAGRYTMLCLFMIGVSLVSCMDSGAAKKTPPPEPPRPQYLDHIVQYQGETLGLISSWYTGRMDNWKRIQEANPGLRPQAIRLGQMIRIPQELVIEQRALPATLVKKVTARKKTEPPPEPEATPEVSDVEAAAPETSVEDFLTAEERGQPPGEDTSDTAAIAADDGGSGADSGNEAGDDEERERLLKELLGE